MTGTRIGKAARPGMAQAMLAVILGRLLRLQVTVFATIAVLGLAAIPVIVLIDLTGRRSIGGMFGALELVEYALLLTTLAACPVLTHHHAHIGGGMARSGGVARRRLVAAIGALACAVLASRMAQLAAEGLREGRVFRQSFDVPELWIWAFAAWAFAAMALDFGLGAFRPDRRGCRG